MARILIQPEMESAVYTILGSLCALTSAFTFAWASGSYSRATLRHSSAVVNCTRLLIGLVFSICIWLFTSLNLSDFSTITGENIVWMALTAIGSFGLGDLFFFKATHHIGVANTLTISSIHPVVTVFISAIWLDQPITLRGIGGVLCITAGTIAVLRNRSNSDHTDSYQKQSIRGILFGFTTTILWSFSSLSIFKAVNGLDITTASIARFAVAFCVVFIMGFFGAISRGQRYDKLVLPGKEFFRILPITIFQMGIGGFCVTYAFQAISLPIAAPLTATSPLFSFLFSVFSRSERFSLVKLGGMISVVLGIGIVVH